MVLSKGSPVGWIPFPIPSSQSCGALEETGEQPVSWSGACMSPSSSPAVPTTVFSRSPRPLHRPCTAPPCTRTRGGERGGSAPLFRPQTGLPGPAREATGGQLLQLYRRELRAPGRWEPQAVATTTVAAPCTRGGAPRLHPPAPPRHPPCRSRWRRRRPRAQNPAAGAVPTPRRCRPLPRPVPAREPPRRQPRRRRRCSLCRRQRPPSRSPSVPPAGCGGRRDGLHQPRLYSGP